MLYWLARWVMKMYLIVFHRLEVRGSENIPSEGAFIFAANHISLLDPPILGAASKRKVHFIAKEELFKIPVFGWVIANLCVIPIKRGAADRQALKIAINVLENGGGFGIFPEGTRSKDGELQKPKHGLAMIAEKTNALIVPAYIVGSNTKGFGKIVINIGKPLTFASLKPSEEMSHKEILEMVSEKVMEQIAALRDKN